MAATMSEHHKRVNSAATPSRPSINKMPRSASYTHVPDLKRPYSVLSTTQVWSNGSCLPMELTTIIDETSDISSEDSSGYTTPDETFGPRSSPLDDKDSMMQLQITPCSSIGEQPEDKDEERTSSESKPDSKVEDGEIISMDSLRVDSIHLARPRPSVSSSASRLTRRSHCDLNNTEPSRSRSLSPSKEVPAPQVVPELEAQLSAVALNPLTKPPTAHSRKKSLVRRKSFALVKDNSTDIKSGESVILEVEEEPTLPQRRPSLLRVKSRPVSGFFRFSSKDIKDVNVAPSTSPPLNSTRKPIFQMSFSTDKLPTLSGAFPERSQPVPRILTASRTASPDPQIRKRDELWNIFRVLEADFAKFSSKSVPFKTHVVRSALMPFLKAYADHPSNTTLRSEDLDRRVSILNKWWAGLLEMLHSRHSQSVSGTDRPTVLEALSGIMERPEWRLAPSPYCPIRNRGQESVTMQSPTSADFDPTAPLSLLDRTIHDNIRNTFTQNLTAQMAFVVDRMSQRHASASLVTYCGKACAYAFMFVPNMADTMIRLWSPSSYVMQRVLAEHGIDKFESLSVQAEAIAANFPSSIQALKFTSVTKFIRLLRSASTLPKEAADLDWRGQWLERWSGRESDLFYVFAKHYHILAADFLELECSIRDRMCAPGMVPVHAQLLFVLDNTFKKTKSPVPPIDITSASSSAQAAASDGQTPMEPDAVATALPIIPADASRTMAENRMIMLIRDFLSDKRADRDAARKWFAESFNSLLQAAAKKVSMFDHNACYLLLDFLEEAFLIIVRHEKLLTKGELMDSNFWESVYKKMVASQNTLTEIRLYSFLHATWRTVTNTPSRKKSICLNLLLDDGIFEGRFNHWCPMVRAYFMRLICWRVGRFDGGMGNADETLILETLLTRLQTSWSHYIFLEAQAVESGKPGPISMPCHPAPNRRLLIMRTDTQPNNNSFLSFDGIVSPSAKIPSPIASPISSRPGSSGSKSEKEPSATPTQNSGISAFMRKFVGGPSPPPLQRRASQTGSATPAVPNAAQMRAELMKRSTMLPAPTPADRSHRKLSFKFTLEYVPSSRGLAHNARLQAPRLPLPAQMYLQSRSARARAVSNVEPEEPEGVSLEYTKCFGMAIAEWNLIVGECHCFFERRKHEGVGENLYVETPALGVEVFKRPS